MYLQRLWKELLHTIFFIVQNKDISNMSKLSEQSAIRIKNGNEKIWIIDKYCRGY